MSCPPRRSEDPRNQGRLTSLFGLASPDLDSLPTANSLKVSTATAARSVLSLNEAGEAEIDGLPVVRGLLKETLIANRNLRKGLKLVLRADEGCPWGKILAAHSAAVQAGYGDDELIYRVKKPLPPTTSTETLSPQDP
ncbi:biopolymer transporter ExbD [bacterium]|nr:biopolymer transporter ExbD [bacterium]